MPAGGLTWPKGSCTPCPRLALRIWVRGYSTASRAPREHGTLWQSLCHIPGTRAPCGVELSLLVGGRPWGRVFQILPPAHGVLPCLGRAQMSSGTPLKAEQATTVAGSSSRSGSQLLPLGLQTWRELPARVPRRLHWQLLPSLHLTSHRQRALLTASSSLAQLRPHPCLSSSSCLRPQGTLRALLLVCTCWKAC